MNKIKILIVTLFFCAFVKAQNFIVYNKTFYIGEGSFKNDEKELLAIDSDKSFYFSYNQPLDEISNWINSDAKINSSRIIENDFEEKNFKISNKSISKEAILTIDYYQDFNWKIDSKVSQEILGFRCLKAIGDFRGRQYTAWFTNDIPLDSGPYKFRGLPGLILKITDSDSLFTYEAIKVILNKEGDFDIESRLSTSFPKEKKDYIIYQDYIEKENKFWNEIRAKIEANRPKNTIKVSMSKPREFQLEKSFEWENPSKTIKP